MSSRTKESTPRNSMARLHEPANSSATNLHTVGSKHTVSSREPSAGIQDEHKSGPAENETQPSTNLKSKFLGVAKKRYSQLKAPLISAIGGKSSAAAETPLHRTQTSTTNVILFGETGVGKSSVINLIAQEKVAKVSSDVTGCTMESTPYDISFEDMNFTIFDTIGLEEPEMGVNGYLTAIEKAFELIKKLEAAGGIHLLLFCMRGGRITATAQSNYRMFYECLCDRKVPIALVFTGLEREKDMEDWWKRNEGYIADYRIKSHGHACITAVHDDTEEEVTKYEESQKKIRRLIKDCALQNAASLPESDSWFAGFAKGLMDFIKKHSHPGRKTLIKTLTKRCGLAPDVAEKIVSMMEKGDPEPIINEDERARNEGKTGDSGSVGQDGAQFPPFPAKNGPVGGQGYFGGGSTPNDIVPQSGAPAANAPRDSDSKLRSPLSISESMESAKEQGSDRGGSKLEDRGNNTGDAQGGGGMSTAINVSAESTTEETGRATNGSGSGSAGQKYPTTGSASEDFDNNQAKFQPSHSIGESTGPEKEQGSGFGSEEERDNNANDVQGGGGMSTAINVSADSTTEETGRATNGSGSGGAGQKYPTTGSASEDFDNNPKFQPSHSISESTRSEKRQGSGMSGSKLEEEGTNTGNPQGGAAMSTQQMKLLSSPNGVTHKRVATVDNVSAGSSNDGTGPVTSGSGSEGAGEPKRTATGSGVSTSLGKEKFAGGNRPSDDSAASKFLSSHASETTSSSARNQEGVLGKSVAVADEQKGKENTSQYRHVSNMNLSAPAVPLKNSQRHESGRGLGSSKKFKHPVVSSGNNSYPPSVRNHTEGPESMSSSDSSNYEDAPASLNQNG